MNASLEARDQYCGPIGRPPALGGSSGRMSSFSECEEEDEEEEEEEEGTMRGFVERERRSATRRGV